jgi:hypothetical protein
MKKRIFLSVLAASLLVLVTGCGKSVFGNEDAGDMKSSNIIIKKDKAKELGLELNIGAGELKVQGGSKDWASGSAEYNYDQLKPEVSYDLNGDTGHGIIEQKNIKYKNLKKLQNKWNLNLTKDIPLDLTVNSGATKTQLNLQGVKLSGLDVNSGVGDVTVDLGGTWYQSFDVLLKMGVGKTTVILPSDVGVKVTSSKGIGKTDFVGLISKGNGIYVNEAYGKSDVTINIQSDLGVGETIFKLER